MSLTIDKVSSGYGETTVLWDVKFDVKEGSITCLLGFNGAGKSTLLKTIMGLLPILKGDIHFRGESLRNINPHSIALKGIAYAPQDTALFPSLTVEENLRVAYRKNGDFTLALQTALEPFPVLLERRNQRAGTLSGGEQKMLFLARALLVSPQLILLDEISEGVQPTILHSIRSTLQSVNEQESTTILLVEQNIDFALRLSDYYLVMKQGRIVAKGIVDSEETRHEIEHTLLV